MAERFFSSTRICRVPPSEGEATSGEATSEAVGAAGAAEAATSGAEEAEEAAGEAEGAEAEGESSPPPVAFLAVWDRFRSFLGLEPPDISAAAAPVSVICLMEVSGGEEQEDMGKMEAPCVTDRRDYST